MRLLAGGADSGIIAGIYLTVAGCARFVEEAYRGEPQTKTLIGLKVYQTFAVVQFAIGVGFLFLSAPGPVVHQVSMVNLVVALLVGSIYAIAMGVDAPGSGRSFSLLTPRD